MSLNARFAHINLIARDWRKLAKFYQAVFGCIFVPPERDFRGDQLDAGTGLSGAHLTGVHLRLPGFGDQGPTLEILNYADLEERPGTAVNRPGYGHMAFQVPDVAQAQQAVLSAGGRAIGAIVTLQIASGARVTWCYVTDPEDNVLELQSWEDEKKVGLKPVS